MMLLRLAAAAARHDLHRHLAALSALATVNTVLQVTPLAVTAGAAIIYGERVGWRRWLAALTGFLGVVLIVKPGGGFRRGRLSARSPRCCSRPRAISPRAACDRDIPSIFVAAASAAAIMLAGVPRCALRRALGRPVGLGLGRDDGLRRLPVRRQHLHHHRRCAQARSPSSPRSATRRCRSSLLLGWLVVGRHPRRHRLPRHRPGAGAPASTPCIASARPEARRQPPRRKRSPAE